MRISLSLSRFLHACVCVNAWNFFPSIYSSCSYLFVYLKAELEKANEISALLGKIKGIFGQEKRRTAMVMAAAVSTMSKIFTKTKTIAYFRFLSFYPCPSRERAESVARYVVYYLKRMTAQTSSHITYETRVFRFFHFFSVFFHSFLRPYFHSIYCHLSL